MEKYFLDKTEEGFRLVFMQYDKHKITEGVRLLQEAVEEGDSDAYGLLGRAYMGHPFVWEHGGVKKDEEIGRMYIRESARKGSACGILTALEVGELTDEVSSAMPFESWNEAADIVLHNARSGHVFCQYMLGGFYCWQEGIAGGDYVHSDGIGQDTSIQPEAFKEIDDKKIQEAAFWLKQALHQKMTLALFYLYHIYSREKKEISHQTELLKLVRIGAECGNPFWQRRLGTLCFCRHQMEEALLWYARAAASGEYPAWFDVGCMYEKGVGSVQDYEMAAIAFEKGAKAGDAKSQGRYGKLLYWGNGVPRDEVKAYYWLSQSYEKDSKDAMVQAYMGHYLLYGTFADPHPSKGISLLQEALSHHEEKQKAGQGLDRETLGLLLLDLGDACEEGLGIKQNFEQAAGYYEMLAREGSQKGKERLSRYKKPLFGRWRRK